MSAWMGQVNFTVHFQHSAIIAVYYTCLENRDGTAAAKKKQKHVNAEVTMGRFDTFMWLVY